MSEVQAIDADETEIGVPTERLCRVLELAIATVRSKTTLSELIRIVESTSRTGVLGSILLLDGRQHLRHGAAPSLPPSLFRSDRRRRDRPDAPDRAAPRLIAASRSSSRTSPPIRCGQNIRRSRLPHGLQCLLVDADHHLAVARCSAPSPCTTASRASRRCATSRWSTSSPRQRRWSSTASAPRKRSATSRRWPQSSSSS